MVSAGDATGGNEPLGLAEEDLAEEIIETYPISKDAGAEEETKQRVSSGSA
jgi:hypothetical protein